jgi:hypothetical protein
VVMRVLRQLKSAPTGLKSSTFVKFFRFFRCFSFLCSAEESHSLLLSSFTDIGLASSSQSLSGSGIRASCWALIKKVKISSESLEENSLYKMYATSDLGRLAQEVKGAPFADL